MSKVAKLPPGPQVTVSGVDFGFNNDMTAVTVVPSKGQPMTVGNMVIDDALLDTNDSDLMEWLSSVSHEAGRNYLTRLAGTGAEDLTEYVVDPSILDELLTSGVLVREGNIVFRAKE